MTPQNVSLSNRRARIAKSKQAQSAPDFQNFMKAKPINISTPSKSHLKLKSTSAKQVSMLGDFKKNNKSKKLIWIFSSLHKIH